MQRKHKPAAEYRRTSFMIEDPSYRWAKNLTIDDKDICLGDIYNAAMRYYKELKEKEKEQEQNPVILGSNR